MISSTVRIFYNFCIIILIFIITDCCQSRNNRSKQILNKKENIDNDNSKTSEINPLSKQNSSINKNQENQNITSINEEKKENKSLHERFLVRILREIIKEEKLNHINITTFSHGWLINIKDTNSDYNSFITGYRFSLNSLSSGEICDDKSLTNALLDSNKIPNVEHKLFFNPNLKGWADNQGAMTSIFEYASKFNNNVVLKMNKGTGGEGIYHCSNKKEIEIAGQDLFLKGYALTISPYVDILEEYRVIMLNDEAKFIYSKERPYVLGDGHSSLNELIIKYFTEKMSDVENYTDLIEIISNLSKTVDLKSVPLKNEKVPIVWKHNLSNFGTGISTETDEETKKQLIKLAKETTKIIQINFCSVDIIKTMQNEFQVLEVNCGVMMEKMPFLIKNGREIAKNIYKEAFFSMLNIKK